MKNSPKCTSEAEVLSVLSLGERPDVGGAGEGDRGQRLPPQASPFLPGVCVGSLHRAVPLGTHTDLGDSEDSVTP